MNTDRKTELEAWLEQRSIRLEWTDASGTQAVLKVSSGGGGSADSGHLRTLPGMLLTGISAPGSPNRPSWPDDRFAWLPNGWTNRRTLCIASSRIGRHPEQHLWWISAIRTACMHGVEDGYAMLAGSGMTAEPFVRRMSRWLDCDLVEVRPAPFDPDKNWFQRIADTLEGGRLFPVWVFSTACDISGISIDGVATGMADTVRVIKVSDEGNVRAAVQQRLVHSGDEGSVWLLNDARGTSVSTRSDLVGRGAIDWLLDDGSPEGNPRAGRETVLSAFGAPIVELPEDVDHFLAHWTRARSRNVVRELENERLDRLLFDESFESRGAIGSLLSIICSGRLVAGSTLTRDSTPVISFTGVALREFRNCRVFRSHLGRWDFELFGIAIRKPVLQKLGARQVIYGAEPVWAELCETDRPFFQLSRGEADGKAIDWREEQEWRLAGDLNLAQFDSADLLVFVPDRETADRVAGFSRWPVAILPAG